MKTINIIKQDGNRCVGIFQEGNEIYLAMTYSASKRFKTIAGAKRWLSTRGYA